MLSAGEFSSTIGISGARFIPPRTLPRSTNTHAKAGLAYERKVLNQLELQCEKNGATLTRGPWLTYSNSLGQSRYCAPDAVIESGNFVLIVEVKLTFVPEGHVKLQNLYLPVITLALPQRQYRTLMVCKNLTALALPTADSISKVLQSSPAYTHTWLSLYAPMPVLLQTLWPWK